MADALVSPPVAGVAGIISGAFLVVAARKVRQIQADTDIVPLMGVMGAFIFAAQMINFSIPGTGSSGHIVGGVLLATLLGPWAGLITLASVLVIQSLIFADGGLMALGCNVFNMAVCTCLVAYPLLCKPLLRFPASLGKIVGISVLTCVVGLELGAVAVTLETEASGITALPLAQFLWFMLPIHLAIGVCEGLATAAVLYFVQQYRPELLRQATANDSSAGKEKGVGRAVLVFALLAAVLGASFHWIASSDPDGLEWSIERVTGSTDLAPGSDGVYGLARHIQDSTALMPDYNTTFSGIVGGLLVVFVTWGITRLFQLKKKPVTKQDE